MKLFDNLVLTANKLLMNMDAKCPNCENHEWDLRGNKRFPTLECQTCHLQIEITTKSNYRIVTASLLIIGFFLLGLFLDLIVL